MGPSFDDQHRRKAKVVTSDMRWTGVAWLLMVCCTWVVGSENRTCSNIRKRSLLFVDQRVCYAGLGCFSTGPPFYHPVYRPISVPPQPPEVIKTLFLLYTRRNPNRPIFLKPGRWKKSTFNPHALTRVVVHGFNDNQIFTSWLPRLKDVILERADENVVIVDWSGSNRLPYSVAVANARLVGAQIAQLIRYLHKTIGASPESFHLIGHSLGAHIAGYAGERLRRLGRITGLDPAGPLFRNVPDVVRLDPGDAVFVDVIHSDPGQTILEGFGSPDDLGDLDFFPGGGDPPGCDRTFSRSVVEDRPTEAIGNLFACQHFRSYEFFLHSFNKAGCLFVGAECASWPEFLSGNCNCGFDGTRCALMGLFAPSYADTPRGGRDRRLFLKVGPERPFCVHQYQVVLHIRSHFRLPTYRVEIFNAEIIAKGSLDKLKAKVHVETNLSERLQTKKFLLTSRRPLGDVKSASVVLSHPGGKRPAAVVEKMEVNYLYPLPRHLVSWKLCRSSGSTSYHGGEQFFLHARACS